MESRNTEDITIRDVYNSISELLSFWPVFILSAFLFLGVAFAYNRYTPNQFLMKATVAVEETDSPLSSVDGMLNLGISLGGEQELLIHA